MSGGSYTAKTVRGDVLSFTSCGSSKHFVAVNQGRPERVVGMRRDFGEAVEWDDGSGILQQLRPGPVIRVDVEGRADPIRMVADTAGEAVVARFLART